MPQKAKQSKRRAARKKAAPVDRLTRAENILAENAKAMAELRKGNAKARAEEDKRRAEDRAEDRARQAKVKKEMAELRAHIRKVSANADKVSANADKALEVARENNRYIGNHAVGEGEILEIECYNTLLKMGKINGVKLERLHLGMNSPQYAVEIDLVGVNGKVTFPMEVKRTLEPADVIRFRDVQVERFKQAFPELAVGKKVVPVVIFALRKKVKVKGKKEDPVQLALASGMIVLQSTGENQLSPVTDISQVVTRTAKND